MTFNDINVTLANNRDEIKEMAYKTSMNLDGAQVRAKAPEQPAREEAYEEYVDDELPYEE